MHTFPQTTLGKRGSPVGEQPQPKKIGTVHHEGHEGHEVRSLRERGHSCPRILAGSLDGAPSAPYTRRLIFGLYDKHVGVSFWIAMQSTQKGIGIVGATPCGCPSDAFIPNLRDLRVLRGERNLGDSARLPTRNLDDPKSESC